MLIAVDEDIPFAAETFARFGEVRRLTSRGFSAAAIRDADALIVRSVTRVNAALLDGSRLRFVGTATSGTDHVDLRYLRERGIAFADALGANANAVAEYVVAALLELREEDALVPSHSSLGIVGLGHVGRRVARYAAALGLRIVVNDPPLARATCEPIYRPLEDILGCDVITLHVPLEHAGTDPTFHLVNDAFLDAVKPSAILINASRGAVVDSAALSRALSSGRLRAAVLDVWENEPAINPDLARACRLATAHIAGHTLDAKIAAVQMLADALAKNVGAAPRGRPVPDPDSRPRADGHDEPPLLPENSPRLCRSLPGAVRDCFDLTAADRRLRDTLALSAADRAAAFDALRAGWPSRREFHLRPVAFEGGPEQDMAVLKTLGFRVTLAGGNPR